MTVEGPIPTLDTDSTRLTRRRRTSLRYSVCPICPTPVAAGHRTLRSPQMPPSPPPGMIPRDRSPLPGPPRCKTISPMNRSPWRQRSQGSVLRQADALMASRSDSKKWAAPALLGVQTFQPTESTLPPVSHTDSPAASSSQHTSQGTRKPNSLRWTWPSRPGAHE